MKRQMDADRSGQLPADAPEEARELMETVSRWVQLEPLRCTRREPRPPVRYLYPQRGVPPGPFDFIWKT
jgi:hypothetical protein